MFIELGTAHCVIRDPDDCTRLHLATALPTTHDITIALQQTGIGRLDEDGSHALINLEQLRTSARASATRSDWDADWDAMIAYAGQKGWISSDGGFVRVHIERPVAGTHGPHLPP